MHCFWEHPFWDSNFLKNCPFYFFSAHPLLSSVREVGKRGWFFVFLSFHLGSGFACECVGSDDVKSWFDMLISHFLCAHMSSVGSEATRLLRRIDRVFQRFIFTLAMTISVIPLSSLIGRYATGCVHKVIVLQNNILFHYKRFCDVLCLFLIMFIESFP